MTVQEALKEYAHLAQYVFSGKKMLPAKGSLYQASKLEQAIKEVVERKLGQGHAEEKMFEVVSPNRRHLCKA